MKKNTVKEEIRSIEFNGKRHRLFAIPCLWGDPGETIDIFLTEEEYKSGGSLAVEVYCIEEDEIEPYATLTVNISEEGGGFLQDKQTAFVDTNNNSWAMKFIKENGLGKKIGEGYSGWCTYPLVKFNTKKFLAE